VSLLRKVLAEVGSVGVGSVFGDWDLENSGSWKILLASNSVEKVKYGTGG